MVSPSHYKVNYCWVFVLNISDSLLVSYMRRQDYLAITPHSPTSYLSNKPSYIFFGSLLTEIWIKLLWGLGNIVLSISQSVMNQKICIMACWKGMKKGSKV